MTNKWLNVYIILRMQIIFTCMLQQKSKQGVAEQ